MDWSWSDIYLQSSFQAVDWAQRTLQIQQQNQVNFFLTLSLGILVGVLLVRSYTRKL